MMFLPRHKGFLEDDTKECSLDDIVLKHKRDVQSPRSNINIANLVIEVGSPRDGWSLSAEKTQFQFNNSLTSLRKKKRGYSRHLRPAEAMRVLMYYLEKKKKKNIAEDMLYDSGEWFSVAFKRKEDTLWVYFDPENLVWSRNQYVVKNGKRLTHAGKFKFDITGISSEDLVDLKYLPQKFVTLMYGRKFEDLPRMMRQGSNKAQVYLPDDGKIWPVTRDYNYSLCVEEKYSASRGVREK